MINMTIADRRDHFYQYDRAAMLFVSGCTEVHFCHVGDEQVISRPVIFHDATADGCAGNFPIPITHGHRSKVGYVMVPPVLLESSVKLIAYGTGEDNTYAQFEFNVVRRPMPQDYCPPSEIPKYSKIEKLIEKKLDAPEDTGQEGQLMEADENGGLRWFDIDTELSDESTRPVANSTVKAAIDELAIEREVDSELDSESSNPVENSAITAALAQKSDTTHTHTTVNGHSVESDVPENAAFTDTVYTHPTSAGNKHIPAGGSSGQILRWSSAGTAEWGDAARQILSLSRDTDNVFTGMLELTQEYKDASNLAVNDGGVAISATGYYLIFGEINMDSETSFSIYAGATPLISKTGTAVQIMTVYCATSNVTIKLNSSAGGRYSEALPRLVVVKL